MTCSDLPSTLLGLFQLGWSSSSLATLRQPTLLLTLTLSNVDGTAQQVPVELTSEELGGLIATLDQLNRVRSNMTRDRGDSERSERDADRGVVHAHVVHASQARLELKV